MNIIEIFQEAGGKLSSGRVCTVLIVLGWLCFAGWRVTHGNDIPDIPGNIAMLAGSLFVGGKAVGEISNVLGKNSGG